MTSAVFHGSKVTNQSIAIVSHPQYLVCSYDVILSTRHDTVNQFTITCICTSIFTAVKNDSFQMNKKDIFLIFAQNIDCGYSLEQPNEAVLKSTHNLCFRAKIGKKSIPL